MINSEYIAAAEISHQAKSNGVDFVETLSKGKALILDRELRNVRHFSKLSDEDMARAFDDQVWSYIVQEQLGSTLEHHLFQRDEAFTPVCCYKIGLQLLEQIKVIHDTGYTFNDLKLDNIMVGYPETIEGHRDYLHKVKMIDFGLAKKYMDENGQHIEAIQERYF